MDEVLYQQDMLLSQHDVLTQHHHEILIETNSNETKYFDNSAK